MTLAVLLERPPRRLVEALDEAAANLLACANELDALVNHPATGPHALAAHATEQRRIGHDVRHHAALDRRAGPERVRPIAIAEATEALAGALDGVGWAWTRCPLPDGVDVLSALRDCVRAVAHGVQTRDPTLLLAQVGRCEEREHETRRHLRAARRELLVQSEDPHVGLCAMRLLHEAEGALSAAARLRGVLHRQALANR